MSTTNRTITCDSCPTTADVLMPMPTCRECMNDCCLACAAPGSLHEEPRQTVICPDCGPAMRCPECGHPMTPSDKRIKAVRATRDEPGYDLLGCRWCITSDDDRERIHTARYEQLLEERRERGWA